MFQIDHAGGRLLRGGEPVDLRPKAFAVLQYLASRPGQLVSKEEILQAAWSQVHVEESVLKVTIGEIRKAFADTSREPQFIETVYGRGYRFIGKLQPHVADTAAIAPPPETRYARSGDVDIAYQVIGEGPFDLVFVMGWLSHLEYFWTEPSFARFLRRLASFSRLILFDKRGTGLSDRVPLTHLPSLEQRMTDLRAVMDAVGSRRAVLCGVSEGAAMAALFAARHPQRTSALVMIGPYAKRIRDATYPWGPTEAERERFLEEMRDRWGGPVGLEERAPSVASDPDFRRWWATYLRMSASPGAAVALTRMNSQVDIRGILPQVRVPTLVLHRTGDLCLRVEEGRYVAELIPGARFVELPGRDHLPFVGDQDAIVGQMQAFLAEAVRQSRTSEESSVVISASFKVARGEPQPRAFLRQRLRDCVAREVHAFGGHQSRWDRHRVLVSFRDPHSAIRCGWALARHASRLDLEARIGIHAGECSVRGGVVEGPAADLARELEIRALPGETVVSPGVRELATGPAIRFQPRAGVSPMLVAEPWSGYDRLALARSA
jgi:pimeloyl-ACP methyl ester carboxylesterase/DNA-binding winged helix-turn-helix (wHTH) protein